MPRSTGGFRIWRRARPGGWDRLPGVTEDGRFIALARFESGDAARRNSDRPEQDRWWTKTSKLFVGEATFRDSSDVTLDLHGLRRPPDGSRTLTNLTRY